MIIPLRREVDGDRSLGGFGTVVECDETWIGGAVEGMGLGYKGNKTAVVGIVQRKGDIVLRVLPNLRRTSVHQHIRQHVKPHGQVHTDEFASYEGLNLHGYWHETVNHKAGQYVSPTGTSVNTLEGAWAALKRGINGTHIHVSGKHLPKYLAEFEYRWNMRQTPHLMLDRLMHSFVR